MRKEQARGLRWMIDLPVGGGLLLFGIYLLLKMAYLPFWQSTLYTCLFLFIGWVYLARRFQIRVPLGLVLLVYLIAALDGVGNYFDLYTRTFRWLQYDELTHTLGPALATPVLVWLLGELLERAGWRLPPGLLTILAVCIMCTVGGFYEIVEYWDDRYMHPTPGMRIHGPYDTPKDLQANLLGGAIGGVAAYLFRRRRVRSPHSVSSR
jgi:uncharacterized membrane protein YjdF